MGRREAELDMPYGEHVDVVEVYCHGAAKAPLMLLLLALLS